MNFGEAIQALKERKCVRREGWNGKNMHIYLEDGCFLRMTGNMFGKVKRKYDPVIIMYTAQATHQAGWLASQADILAEDWEIVELEEGDVKL